ncbi:MAG: aspartyl-tRNA synthetase [Actinomycetota bacterium]|jgi:aspartyl-tRNA synthetase|nr:aspartyl-tRNA synthetase [Actinomycetota bacterium]
MMRSDYCGRLGVADIGRPVELCGWVATRREQGKHLAFVDLRDHTGVIQCVVDGAHELRSEFVVKISGVVRTRPEGTVNPALATGEIEVGDCAVEILSRAEPPPFPISDRIDADELLRLRHRYLDLRRPVMQRNLRLRAAVMASIRRTMEANDFLEVETPVLVASTPEGARDFVVPSRLQTGKFYALPQSPQLFKQLLMVGGVDRYYQMARCLRDEDLRADRQFEFTQLDAEASFVDQADVIAFISEAVVAAVEAGGGGYPGRIPHMTWRQAQESYGTDKPDLRFGMEIMDVTPVFENTEFRAFLAPAAVKAIRVPGGAGAHGRAVLDRLTDRTKKAGAAGLVWMKVTDECTLDSPVARFLGEGEQKNLMAATESQPGDLLLIVAGDRVIANRVLGMLRLDLGRPPVTEGGYKLVWVTDFPLFEGLDAEGRPIPAHHPFTMPHPDDLDRLESDPLSVRSQAYDLVLNGWELGSGSVRIHRSDVQQRIFSLLGIGPEAAQRKFGFLLDGFRHGAPPHAGFAFGIDRLVAILAGEENIREVIAFPKTQSGVDPLTGAPSTLDERQLADLGLRLREPPA